MGYSTKFDGQFNLDKPLTTEHLAYLKRFARIRHMRWLEEIVGYLPDSARTAVGLPAGPEGMYLTNDLVMSESYNAPYPHHGAIIDYSREPAGVPGLWLQWVPTEDGTAIKWDGREKFYDYVTWLEFLIAHFLIPWGYALNGRVKWQGDDMDDCGEIVVNQNAVTTQEENETKQQGPKQPLDEKQAEIERLRLSITIARGCIIGALAGGHLDGEYGAEYGKNVLHQIADALGIDIPESVK